MKRSSTRREISREPLAYSPLDRPGEITPHGKLPDTLVKPSALNAEDLLINCAGSEDQDLWAEFLNRFHLCIGSAAWRAARRWGETSHAVVEELVQDTYCKLWANDCRVLRTFQPLHVNSAFSFLQAITANLVHDRLKSRIIPGGPATPFVEALSERDHANNIPGGLLPAEKDLLMSEIADIAAGLCVGRNAARDRIIFDLYYWQGFSAEEIAALPGIELTAKGVGAVTQRLMGDVRLQLAERRLAKNAEKLKKTVAKSASSPL